MKGGIIVDWNAIKAEYIAGGTTYKELAVKYDVSESKIKRIAAKEKWSELLNQTRTKANQKLTESISDGQAEAAVSAVQLINESALNMLRQIAKETAEGESDPDKALSESKFTVYARALKQLKEVLDIKSEKDREEQQARIDNLRRQADADTFDGTVEFIFKGDAEKWAK